MKSFFLCLIFLHIVFLCSHALTADADTLAGIQKPVVQSRQESVRTPQQAWFHVRGLEREEKQAKSPFKIAWSAMSFIPRQIMFALQYATGYGMDLASDPKLIDSVKDILYNDTHSFGWYPMIDLTSGYRPRAGANLFYRKNATTVLFRSNFAGPEKYLLHMVLSHHLDFLDHRWRLMCSGLSDADDDRKFYGYGADPQANARNPFSGSDRNGSFTQQRQKFYIMTGFELNRHWQFYWLNMVYRRFLDAHRARGGSPLAAVYHLSELPGYQPLVEQAYTELAACFTSMANEQIVSPGLRCEFYAGHSMGIRGDKSRFYRAGTDLCINIPVFLENRLLSARMVADVTANLTAGTSIPFTDYSKQPWFPHWNISGHCLLTSALICSGMGWWWRIIPGICDWIRWSGQRVLVSIFTQSIKSLRVLRRPSVPRASG